MKRLHQKLQSILLFALFFPSIGCVPPATQQVPDRAEESGSFSIYLQPLPQEMDRLTFVITDLAAVRSDGEKISLPLKFSRFNNELIGKQKKLANITLPPGRYRGIVLQIESASLDGEQGRSELLAPEDPLFVEFSFLLRDEQAETLFLSLSGNRLVTDGVLFTPRFSLWKPDRLLTNLKGFVCNLDSNNLTIFNKRTTQVVGHLRVGREPSDLALDQRRNWLYVALAGENAIVIVEVTNNSLLGRVPLRFGDQPSELALTSDGRTLLALNSGSDSVSIIDTESLFETGRVRLLSTPSGIFLGHDDSRAYATQAESSRLSIFDLNSETPQTTIPLNEAPLDGVSSHDGRSIYLINEFSAQLSVLDPASLVSRQEIYIGNGAVTLLEDPSTGLLYIGKQNGEIAIVDPRSLIAIDRFTLPGRIQDLAIDHEENALFTVLPDQRQLLKIDLVSKRELARIELDPASRAVVVMGER